MLNAWRNSPNRFQVLDIAEINLACQVTPRITHVRIDNVNMSLSGNDFHKRLWSKSGTKQNMLPVGQCRHTDDPPDASVPNR